MLFGVVNLNASSMPFFLSTSKFFWLFLIVRWVLKAKWSNFLLHFSCTITYLWWVPEWAYKPTKIKPIKRLCKLNFKLWVRHWIFLWVGNSTMRRKFKWKIWIFGAWETSLKSQWMIIKEFQLTPSTDCDVFMVFTKRTPIFSYFLLFN